MRKYLFLLVLPYVVTVSTDYSVWISSTGRRMENMKVYTIKQLPYICQESEDVKGPGTCTWVYDMAEALNMARERRIKELPK